MQAEIITHCRVRETNAYTKKENGEKHMQRFVYGCETANHGNISNSDSPQKNSDKLS